MTQVNNELAPDGGNMLQNDAVEESKVEPTDESAADRLRAKAKSAMIKRRESKVSETINFSE